MASNWCIIFLVTVSEWRRGTRQWILITVSYRLFFFSAFPPYWDFNNYIYLFINNGALKGIPGNQCHRFWLHRPHIGCKCTGMSSLLMRASIHCSGCPVCRCWSSHVEQRKRSFTPHLPAGAHSSLENQVSLLNGRLLEARIRCKHTLFL